MKKHSFILIALFFLTSSLLCAQEKTIKVWENKIPGAINDPSYTTETIYIDGNKPRVTKVTDPTLDFYPISSGKQNSVAIVICPGGAYGRLAMDKEGSEVAAWLNKIGIHAFVLKYRLPNDAIMIDKSIGPLQDGQEAIRIVRRHAKEWNIDPHKIGIMGFSAGGHLAATVSTHFNDKLYEMPDTTSARPDFSILVYPVISMDSSITHKASRENLLSKNPSKELVRRFSNELCVGNDTPPALVVHALDDNTVPVQNSINYVLALKRNGVSGELHIYEKGGHGFGLGKAGKTESNWPDACEKWLRAKGIL